MKRPAIFFDRDNTLLISDGYLFDPAAILLVEGAANAVARARRLGFATVIFSNQSGVARGMFDESAVEAVNSRLDRMLRDQNPAALIDRHEYCPYLPDAAVEKYRQDSDLRKPKPGMIFKAADAMALDLQRSWVIGDAPRDIAAGQAAGCRTILFTDPTLPPSAAAAAELDREPDARVGTLKGALDFIEHSMHSANAPASSDSIDSPAPVEIPMEMVADEPPVKAQPSVEAQPPAAAEISGGTAPPPPVNVPAVSVPIAGVKTESAAPASAAIDVDALAAAIARETAAMVKKLAPPPAMSIAGPAPVTPASSPKLEHLLDQFLQEFKRSRAPHPPDFSVSKLLAGIVQIMAVGALVLTYFLHLPITGENTLLLAIALQTLTIALLVMGRQT